MEMNVEEPVEDDGNNNEFDTDFDAGVEADEENDPKKYIQQLTGKLSQSLRQYNAEQPETDADLNKYVAGMIVKQAVEGLSGKDRNEILKKVGKDEKEADGPDLEDVDNENEEDNDAESSSQQGHAMGESVNREKMINELFQDIMSIDKPKSERKPNRVGAKGYRNRPY